MKIIYKIWWLLPWIIKQYITKIILYCYFNKIKISWTIIINIYQLLKKRIIIWDYTFIWDNSKLLSSEDTILKIWKYCSIASDFYAITYNHSKDYLTHHISQNKNLVKLKHNNRWASIQIWNDVWIWTRVIILPWVNIWDWAIIWAWSIVTKNIPAYSIAVWNPAKVIKLRFSEEKIKLLENIEWWKWSDKKIKKNKFIFNININNIDTKTLKDKIKSIL